MDLLMFGLCLVVWVLCMSKVNGDSEKDRQHKDILRSTLYGEIGPPENTTGLERIPKSLLQDHVEKTGQKLVLRDQTFEVNSLSNTDKQENESTKAFTDPPEISSGYTNKKYDYPAVSEKTSNFSKKLTEISTKNFHNTPLNINYKSKDNNEQKVHNDQDKPSVENTTLSNNLDANTNNNEKHKCLSNERETNHLKYLISPDGNEILLLRKPPVPDRLVDKTLFATTKNILLKDDLPKVQIENTNSYEILNPLSRDEAWLKDSIRELGVSTNLDQSDDSHTPPSLRKHNVPVTDSKKQNSDDFTLEAVLDMLAAKLGTPYIPKHISQPERIQYQQPRNQNYHSKNYFDYHGNGYNTEYKSKRLSTSDNQVQWQPVAGSHLVNYQSGPYGFVPTPKVNQLQHQFFNSDFPMVPRRSGFFKTFYNRKANNWGNEDLDNKHMSPSFYTSTKLNTKPNNIPGYSKKYKEFLSDDNPDLFSTSDYDSYG